MIGAATIGAATIGAGLIVEAATPVRTGVRHFSPTISMPTLQYPNSTASPVPNTAAREAAKPTW